MLSVLKVFLSTCVSGSKVFLCLGFEVFRSIVTLAVLFDIPRHSCPLVLGWRSLPVRCCYITFPWSQSLCCHVLILSGSVCLPLPLITTRLAGPLECSASLLTHTTHPAPLTTQQRFTRQQDPSIDHPSPTSHHPKPISRHPEHTKNHPPPTSTNPPPSGSCPPLTTARVNGVGRQRYRMENFILGLIPGLLTDFLM